MPTVLMELSLLDAGGDRIGQQVQVHRLVLRVVGDADAPADVQDLQLQAELVLGSRWTMSTRTSVTSTNGADLLHPRPDVAVQTDRG